LEWKVWENLPWEKVIPPLITELGSFLPWLNLGRRNTTPKVRISGEIKKIMGALSQPKYQLE